MSTALAIGATLAVAVAVFLWCVSIALKDDDGD